MVRWIAVIIGFMVGVLVGVVGLALPVIGQIGAGLIGGFVAGWLAAGGLVSGTWHGLLAGAFGGVLLAAFIVIITSVLGVSGVIDPVSGLIGGGGTAVAVLFLAALLAIDSAIGGAIGGVLRS
jgi:hypothetical protein